jgi:hypothetical protein
MDVAMALARIIDYLIEPVYATIRPIPRRTFTPNGRYDYTFDIMSGTNSVFFYPEWTEKLKEQQISAHETPMGIVAQLSRLLSYLQLGLAKSPALFAKLCRIAVHSIKSSALEDTTQIREAWRNVISEYLLPATSCMRANPGKFFFEAAQFIRCIRS